MAFATRLSLMIARRAVAVSDYAAQTIAPFWMRDKISVVHHGVSEMFRAQNDTDVAARKNFLLMVADIYVQKNLHTVIKALARLKETHPNVELSIAGSILDRAYYNQLRTQIERLGLSKNIYFLGSKSPEEVKELYRTCRAMIFASTVEAFGNPLVEAMASSCPIISSDAAAMPEVAGDGVLYFNPYDDGALASLLDRVLSDQSLCDDLSNRASLRAKSFSWSLTAEKTAQILRDAASLASKKRHA
ncbi:MAG: glycosyltransferase family 1 protein [Rhodospirillales bacterium]